MIRLAAECAEIRSGVRTFVDLVRQSVSNGKDVARLT